MTVYRIFPAVRSAAPDAPGGALFVPTSGNGRIANPGSYDELYFADSPEGAIAETFGRLSEWHSGMLTRAGRPLALATCRFPDDVALCDLDDPQELVRLTLRPSEVVTSDRRRSQAWARAIYERRAFGGIRWWSRLDSRWFVVGIWRTDLLESAAEPEELRIDDPRIARAAEIIVRRLSS